MEEFMKEEMDTLQAAVTSLQEERLQIAKGNKAAAKRARIHLKVVGGMATKLRKMSLDGPPKSE